MSTNPYHELQARYIAGNPLSREEGSQLLRWLEGNPDERREMLADEAIDNQLRCLARLGDDELAEKFIVDTVERAVSTQHVDDGVPVIRTLDTNRPRSFQWFSIPVGVCAAAIVLIGVAFTWYSTTRQNQDDFGFAKIANAKNLSWELIDEGSRRLSVSSGSGEVHFDNGTIAQFSAPAVIELKTPGSLLLETGSVKINVPPAAIGFTVETPIARIVDFGTRFDVAVGNAGQTETRVRSGTVTFQAHPMSLTQSRPIKLTAGGLNRATAVASELTTDVRSVTTTASGSQGQFHGTIHADGKTADFKNRREFVDFLSRLHSSLQEDRSPFQEQWKVVAETTANGSSTMVESNVGSGRQRGSSAGRADEMLIEQLRSMRGLHQGNQQMQQLLEGMMRQVEEVHGKRSD